MSFVNIAQIFIDADNLEEYLEENFHLCPKISIDYAVLEKADSVLVIEADFFWNDIGSWSELKKLYPQDEDENTIVGNAVVQNTHGCIIKSDSETLVCVLDMQNLIVIQDGNGVLIYPRDSESQIKNLLQLLPEHWK